MSSSSDADQLRFITARAKSVSEYSTPIETSTGIAITDCLRFFTDATPAKQFEAGCKRGGKRKCVLCGCLAHLHDDFAYCARQSLLSCNDRQMLVLAGRFGRTPGAVKPLSDLSSLDLRSELNSRNVPLMGTTKPQFEKQLSDILRGSVRVPALLSNAPEMVLVDLNLSNYSILPVEPLHDIKGHMINIFMSPELPKQQKFYPHLVQLNSNSALSRPERVAIKPTWRVAVIFFSQALESGGERKVLERMPE